MGSRVGDTVSYYGTSSVVEQSGCYQNAHLPGSTRRRTRIVLDG